MTPQWCEGGLWRTWTEAWDRCICQTRRRIGNMSWCSAEILIVYISLRWWHNERVDVSNHRRLDYLLNRCSDADQRKLQSSASLVFVRGIHRWQVASPHKGPVTRKMFPLDDIMFPISVPLWNLDMVLLLSIIITVIKKAISNTIIFQYCLY